jgi:hypothetical protein
MAVMKSSLWFEASMLALILVAAVISAASDKTPENRDPADTDKYTPARSPPAWWVG